MIDSNFSLVVVAQSTGNISPSKVRPRIIHSAAVKLFTLSNSKRIQIIVIIVIGLVSSIDRNEQRHF